MSESMLGFAILAGGASLLVASWLAAYVAERWAWRKTLERIAHAWLMGKDEL